MSLPKIQTQTLSSHHDTKSCSLENRDPIHNRDVPQHQPGIQARQDWCQNDFRTQGNSSILLLLTIGKGNDCNIIKYGESSENFQWWT